MQDTSDDYNPSRSKKRKMDERVVVTVKIKENDKKQHTPSDDCWSWRKYGQKPIKGSPYPRGYYKCSTAKGCSAKKQVERCKIDASMLIITYTSTHNHPGPKSEKEEEEEEEKEELEAENSAPNTPKQDQEKQVEEPQEEQAQQVNDDTDDQFHYSQSPFNSSHDHIMVNQESGPFLDETPPGVLYNENVLQPLPQGPASFSSLLKPEEYDLYDELEELPTSSFFTKFIKSSFCEERITVNPA